MLFTHLTRPKFRFNLLMFSCCHFDSAFGTDKLRGEIHFSFSNLPTYNLSNSFKGFFGSAQNDNIFILLMFFFCHSDPSCPSSWLGQDLFLQDSGQARMTLNTIYSIPNTETWSYFLSPSFFTTSAYRFLFVFIR